MKTRPIVRALTESLGLASILFGLAPFLAPRFFGRMFGLGTVGSGSEVTVRSLGLRDVMIGAGILSAVLRGGDARLWVQARTACDIGDTLSCGLTLAAQPRNWRLWTLAGIALGAALVDGCLLWLQEAGHSERELSRI